MIRLGPAGYPPGSADAATAVEMVKSMGLTALEVQFVRNVQMAHEKAVAARIKAERLGIMLSAHAPYYISLNSTSPETIEKSVEWILRTARAAKDLGAWIIVIHAASYTGVNSERTTSRVIEGIKRCRETLEMERNDVVLGLETMGKIGQWGTLSEIHEVMRHVEGVQPVIDFAHIHARGQGSIKGADDFAAILDEHDRIPVKRRHCHFSGIEFGPSGEKNHLPLSSRSPDYALLAELIAGRQDEMTLICESPDPSGDALRMATMIDERSM